MSDPLKLERPRLPQAEANDYTHAMGERRRAFVQKYAGTELRHVAQYSVEPETLAGKVESFVGVTQVPLGVAGPLSIDGEHLQGDVFVPLATTEGGLVAHCARGMRLLEECGGVKTTLVATAMPRAPVFSFSDAREARSFADWLSAHTDAVRRAAERTTSVGKLVDLSTVIAGSSVFVRFNYTTGDVAGQNVTTKATLAACEWVKSEYPKPVEFLLSSGMEGEHRQIGLHALMPRGRRVIAEAQLLPEPTRRLLGVTTEQLARGRAIQQLGQAMAGGIATSAHVASGLGALFIATGQDVANLAESHGALFHGQLLNDGRYQCSLTLPSLVVATYGGGTGLPTQREALSMLGCYGKDKADKFAEICAALALASELGLAPSTLSAEAARGVDKYARNRP